MSFSDPRWLWALWALPVLAVLEAWALRGMGARVRALVGDRAPHPLLAQRDPRAGWIGAALRLAALACVLFGAAGPEWGREMVRRGSSGSDVVLVIDVSTSMDARDVPPSRIDEARREALAVLDRLQGSRVAVVAFAGDAVRLCPLTLDLPAARLVVESLSTGALSTPGTDLGKGLRLARQVVPSGRRDEQAIVLWTDGEDLEAGARSEIDALTRSGVRVFAVGVGTRDGDVIPLLDPDGHVSDIKRDEKGTAVRSRLDENLLRTLSQRTRGAYFSADRPGGELGRLLGAVTGLARAGRTQRLSERPVPRFPLFAALAAFLLLVDRVRRRRPKSRRETGPELHSERTAAAAMLALALLVPARAAAQSGWERGNRAFAKSRYAEADSLYAKRLARGGPAALRVNRATVHALAGHADEAERDLERLANDPSRAGAAAGYNLGTIRAERRNDDGALEALRRAIERDPRDADARWNYEVVLARQRNDQDPKQPPKQGGGGGGGAPQPSPSQPRPQPSATAPSPSPSNAPRTPAPGQASGMTKEQADRLLNALQEMARTEQQRHRSSHAVQTPRSRDW